MTTLKGCIYHGLENVYQPGNCRRKQKKPLIFLNLDIEYPFEKCPKAKHLVHISVNNVFYFKRNQSIEWNSLTHSDINFVH